VKFFSTLLVAVGAALVVYAARHRIVYALKVGAVVYIVMLPLRLLTVAGEAFERLDELIWPLVGLLVLWVVLWWVSTSYERRKQAREASRRATLGPTPTIRRRRSP